jgi:hypothetical protein
MTTYPPTVTRMEVERAELEAVLASELFARTSNLVRFLSFVCERYFAGETDAIKEYSIAVEALGRPGDFDPQTDTIVRVTAHALRRRLQDFYRTAGSDHPIQICLPAGHYVPRFIDRNLGETPHAGLEEPADLRVNGDLLFANGTSVGSNGAQSHPTHATASIAPAEPAHPRGKSVAIVIAVVVIAVIALATVWVGRHYRSAAANLGAQPTAPAALDDGVRVLVGEKRPAYTDRAGFVWEEDRFCSGGSSFSIPDRPIRGTGDAPLFLGGRSGTFQCRIPVVPGHYEVHLLFAETSGLQENARNVVFSVNGGPVVNLDVVDDAAGDDVATVKVLAGVEPQSDGAIHLDFASSQSFLNAVEIVRSTGGAVLPVRIVTGHATYRDAKGTVWLPDRYAFGGRLSRSSGDLSKIADAGLYEWQRIGHFRYVIPVAPGRPYTLKMYFREPWFGAHNGNAGGVGSRTFDVACNGSMLLKNFDILAEAGTEPVVRTFPHIQPTAQGKIEISFTPVLNYPSVNALEVIPE